VGKELLRPFALPAFIEILNQATRRARLRQRKLCWKALKLSGMFSMIYGVLITTKKYQ
jgi:hypothetical protein